MDWPCMFFGATPPPLSYGVSSDEVAEQEDVGANSEETSMLAQPPTHPTHPPSQ